MLALGAAAFYGSADFMGGLAARRSSALSAAFGAQVSGLVVLVAGLVVVGAAIPTPTDLGLGAVAGVFGGLGLVALYRSLARGPMDVVTREQIEQRGIDNVLQALLGASTGWSGSSSRPGGHAPGTGWRGCRGRCEPTPARRRVPGRDPRSSVRGPSEQPTG